MINENVGTAKDYTNATVIDDMEVAQASFKEARAETQSQRERILWELESVAAIFHDRRLHVALNSNKRSLIRSSKSWSGKI